jgi:potassium/chloride transporter 4/5/6
MKKGKVTGFARTLVAPSYREGKTYALQASGLGALEPNTLLMGWPHRWETNSTRLDWVSLQG